VKRRELWEPLVDVLTSLVDAGQAGVVRVRGVRLDLPMEIELRGTRAEPTLVGDLPRWRWPTAFDLEPGRFRVVWEEMLT
jgi:hypothetical protein